ncbi:S-layer homology domain-containing protein [Candidatus Peregrinibacteria bacterium]|nr:S-layer homology domain-containing protein [Candidatus Peregrinibacteria bacterium]
MKKLSVWSSLRSRYLLATLRVACLLLFFLVGYSVFAANFSDIPQDNKNKKAIDYLSENGSINGYGDNTFKPDAYLNRAEAVKIIVNAFKIPVEEKYDKKFPDVKESDWFFKYVMAADKAGLVKGYNDGKFKPSNTVNLAEALKILFIAAKVDLPKNVDSIVFADVAQNSWYAPYALFAGDNNIVVSDDQGNLKAEQPMTRSVFAEIIYRTIIVAQNNGKPFPLDMYWKTYEGKNLPFKMKYDDTEWNVIENNNDVVFLKKDKAARQFSAAKIYPNSARIWVTLDENKDALSKDKYFQNISTSFQNAKYTEFKLGDFNAFEVLYSKDRTVDWYIYLNNGKVLVVYTEFGGGYAGFKLRQFIKGMLFTLEYKEIPEIKSLSQEDKTQFLNTIFKNVLVEKTGMEMLNKITDKIIIETDTVGVGTGPVDYYFSQDLNYTFKYERAGDVILDKREGKTSAF